MPDGKKAPHERAHEWGARAITTLQEAGLLGMRQGEVKLVPTDEAGVVEGVFVPLGDPATVRLVVLLLDQYLARARQAAGDASAQSTGQRSIFKH